MLSDIIIVGAGFAGSVLAERFAADAGKTVLLIEKKSHPGGHCRDYVNEHGFIIHEYGPHIFHTNEKSAWQYLSRFTDWHSYQHKVVASLDGQSIPIPFNLNSLHLVYPPEKANKVEKKLIDFYCSGERIPIVDLRKQSDPDLRELGDFIYDSVFLNYTKKQWGGKTLEELDPSVSSRVPFVVSYDDGYFSDSWQGIPTGGYSPIFRKLLDHGNISLLTDTDALELVDVNDNRILFNGKPYSGILIYTGMIDELFGFRYKEFPYRSLHFEFKDYQQEYFQDYAVVNYPNDYEYTRVTEYKHFQPSPERTRITTVCYEYPDEYRRSKNDPFYVVPTVENRLRLSQYRKLADAIPNLITVGRLAEYRYYNMDQVVSRALDVYSELS